MALNNSKASGVYDINTEIIKATAQHISEPFTDIFNCSLQTAVFPLNLKVIKVIPVYKSKDSSGINNYRPIPLLPIISKVFEHLMLNRLNKFLDKYKIINYPQHGFRKGLSTTTAAFEYLEKIYELLDKKVKLLEPLLIFQKLLT
jgi:hypothetical protein